MAYVLTILAVSLVFNSYLMGRVDWLSVKLSESQMETEEVRAQEKLCNDVRTHWAVRDSFSARRQQPSLCQPAGALVGGAINIEKQVSDLRKFVSNDCQPCRTPEQQAAEALRD